MVCLAIARRNGWLDDGVMRCQLAGELAEVISAGVTRAHRASID